MASFLAKPGQEMPKKRKKNISFWVPFLLDLGCCIPQKIKTNSKKIEKIKKHHSDFISSQTQSRQAEKGGKKFSFQVPFLPDLGRSIPQKNRKNNLNNKKNVILVLFLVKPSYDRLEKKKKKPFRVMFLPYPECFQKNH